MLRFGFGVLGSEFWVSVLGLGFWALGALRLGSSAFGLWRPMKVLKAGGRFRV